MLLTIRGETEEVDGEAIMIMADQPGEEEERTITTIMVGIMLTTVAEAVVDAGPPEVVDTAVQEAVHHCSTIASPVACGITRSLRVFFST